jgi:hypothetical protein
MSLYTNVSDKNLLNLGKQTLALDVSTRNPYFSTIVGFEAGILNTGLYNVFYGYRAGYKVKKAQRSVLLGANAGLNLDTDDNVLIGFNAGKNIVTGVQNVHIGNFAADNLNGNNNIIIGFKNTFDTSTLESSSNNVGIGFQSTTLGYFNNCYGNNNDISSFAATVLGTRIIDRSSNSLLIGQNIANTGNNSLIIHTKYQATFQGLENSNENYLNIQDCLVGEKDNTGSYVLSLRSSNLNIAGSVAGILINSNITFYSGQGPGVTIGESVILNGKYTRLELLQYAYLGSSNTFLKIQDNVDLIGKYGYLTAYSNITTLSSGSNDSLLKLEQDSISITHSNRSMIFMDDIVTIQGKQSEMVLGSNYVTIANDENSWINMDESMRFGTVHSDILLSSNLIGITGPESRMLIGSNVISFCNTDVSELHMDKSIQFRSPYSGSMILTSNYGYLHVHNQSSIFFDQNVDINSTSGRLLLGSNTNVLRHGSSSEIVMDATVQLKSTHSGLIIGSNYLSCSNSSNSSLHMSESILMQTRHGTTLTLSSNLLTLQLQSNVITMNENHVTYTASGRFNSNISILGPIRMCRSNFDTSYWDIFLGRDGPVQAADLVFKSRNGTVISWTDDFAPEVLNFTGKHRCTMKSFQTLEHLIGRIVISQGWYQNLDDKNVIDMDEAIPVIELSTRRYDTRAFGVISDFERPGKTRTYKLGNMVLSHPKDASSHDKVIVNSVGEGAIWVVNCNGNLQNGDLITTSHLEGYGMRQKSKVIKSYTVGKITCDCSFELDSDIYRCQEFIQNGYVYRRAFVGCVYKF